VAQTINTNIAALSAQRYLNRSQSDIANAMSRLSSGLRINSAKDDAAGLASAERMTTQVRGLNVASRNTNDAVSLVQTAEGALGNVSSVLQRIRELAVQSANASYSASDRVALNNEAQELISEVQRLSRDTEFNGVKLLDGSFTKQTFQVGANEGQQLTIDKVTDTRISALGLAKLDLSGAAMGKAVAGDSLPDSLITEQTGLILETAGGKSQSISWKVSTDDVPTNAATIAKLINDNAGPSGVRAVAANSATLTGLTAAGTVSMKLNGKDVSAKLDTTGDMTALINEINGAGAGVTATFASPPAKDGILLTSSDGADISIANFASTTEATKVTVKGPKDPEVTLDDTNKSTRITGTVELSSTNGAIKWTGATEAADVGNVFDSASGDTPFKSIGTVDLYTAEGSRAALSVIDGALEQINVGRSELGAKQNRLEALLSNIDTMSENFVTARGRLMDADFAKETAALSRAQILQQAGTAMLAQANALPQQVLQLLKG
jgi:flagellin